MMCVMVGEMTGGGGHLGSSRHNSPCAPMTAEHLSSISGALLPSPRREEGKDQRDAILYGVFPILSHVSLLGPSLSEVRRRRDQQASPLMESYKNGAGFCLSRSLHLSAWNSFPSDTSPPSFVWVWGKQRTRLDFYSGANHPPS
jgi:hypothetical protein